MKYDVLAQIHHNRTPPGWRGKMQQWLEKNERYRADIVLNLRPTTPFKTAEDIDNAIRIALDTDCDAVRSFVKVEDHPYWMYWVKDDKSGNKAEPFIKDKSAKEYPRRQLLPPVYFLNGCVEVMTARNLKKGVLYGEDMRAYIMPAERSLDIDTPEDLEMFKIQLKIRKLKR